MTDPRDSTPAYPELAEPAVVLDHEPDGTSVLRSAHSLGPYPRCLGDLLLANAARWPDRVFLGERIAGPDSPWRTVTWAEARVQVEALAAALLARGAGPERPVMLLSGNSIAHALLTLAAMHVGVPAAPISVAYSLLSRDFSKLRRISEQLTPSVIFCETREPFANAIAAVGLDRLPCLTRSDIETITLGAESYSSAEIERRFATIEPNTIAKVLFTSGSTGTPKGVVNTQRMLCSNQAALAVLWPFLAKRAAAGEGPVICDWLPWNHTFGANFNFNLVLMHAGTLWIDAGKPAPGQFAATVANLRERAPTLYFNVPRGFELLVPELERDADLRRRFFSRLDLIFYAAAALPQNLWTRLEQLALEARGEPILMVSAWGSTETAPCSTAVHWPIERAGVIGNPMPGTEIALVPNQDKLELRVRGPNVTPGYWREPELSAAAFDARGFYRIGDAGKLADPDRPERGLVFDGRVSEDFKLTSGTWVHVGKLRVEAIAACEPWMSDCVIAGHDRSELGLLVFPNLAACRSLVGLDDDVAAEVVVAHPAVRAAIASGLGRHNRDNPGNSTRFARAWIEAEPPSIDADEITDKGYLNQRAVLGRRATSVARMFADDPSVVVPKRIS